MDQMDGELVTSLVNGGKAWLVYTIAAFMPTLWAVTLIFHFARPYVMRILRSLTLRFGGDVWWLSYVLIRDAMMLITLSLGTVLLLPGLYLATPLPLFAPLASLVLFWALVVKLFGDADDDARTFRTVSQLLVAGATLFFVSLLFGVEANEQTYLGAVPAFLVSSTNPAWAVPIVTISLAGYGAAAAYIFWRFTRTLRRPAGRTSEEAPKPVA